MVEMNQVKTVQVNAKTLRLYCKIRDCFTASLHDQGGQEIGEYDGYVPEFMPGQHFGYYLILDIDIDSGQITNWQTPSPQQLEETFVKSNEE